MNCITVLLLIGVAIVGCTRPIGETESDNSKLAIDVAQTYEMVLDDVRTRDRDPIMEIRKYCNINEVDSMYVQLFELKNKNTEYLIVQTGEQRDLLDGGGHYYCYMLVNGQWVFLRRISWNS